MAINGYPVPVTEHTVHANGIDIWYVEAGEGIPLLLLHGGTMSNGPLWVHHPYGWGTNLGLFAQHFRVLLPDTRGHGRTRNPSGEMSYPLFAQDYLAFIEALALDHPCIAGFSDGGTIATLIGIMAPEVPRALVDWSGYQMFHPEQDAWIYRDIREWLGGSPQATQVDFDAVAGRGSLGGDRDPAVRLPEVYARFQQLPQDELGIVPGIVHQVSQTGCLMILDYLLRRRDFSSYQHRTD